MNAARPSVPFRHVGHGICSRAADVSSQCSGRWSVVTKLNRCRFLGMSWGPTDRPNRRDSDGTTGCGIRLYLCRQKPGAVNGVRLDNASLIFDLRMRTRNGIGTKRGMALGPPGLAVHECG